MSTYQKMKPIILELFQVSRDAIHMHVGFGCLVLVLFFSSKKLNSFQVLIPGFILSIIMEILDLRDDYAVSKTVNIAASIHDLINTNFIPVVLVLMAKMKRVRV